MLEQWHKDLLISAGLPADIEQVYGKWVHYTCEAYHRTDSYEGRICGVVFGGSPLGLSFDPHADETPKTSLIITLEGIRRDMPVPYLVKDEYGPWMHVEHEWDINAQQYGWHNYVVRSITIS